MSSQPGVYWFLDKDNTVLYVGKAKNLKNRLRSYSHLDQLSDRIRQLSTSAERVKFRELGSELEALLVEAELIRTYQPRYNVLLKDDKSPLYIEITDEQYPRVIQRRKREIVAEGYQGKLLGPFPSAYKTREVLRLARRIFPWCNERGDGEIKDRACFYFHLEQCPGACIGKITPEEYQAIIRDLTAFLQGKKKTVLKELETKLKKQAATEQFEAAAKTRDTIKIIEEVTARSHKLKPQLTTPALTQQLSQDGLRYLQRILSQYLLLPNNRPLHRIEGYDVSNIFGKQPAVAMVTFSQGQPDKAQYRLFNIRTLDTPNDYHMLKEALLRRQNHPEWGRPDLLVIDGGKGQVRAALTAWRDDTPIIGIAKNPDRLVIPLRRTKQHQPKEKYVVLKLPEQHPGLQLIERIRDEAHRFSKKQHSRIRLRQMFE